MIVIKWVNNHPPGQRFINGLIVLLLFAIGSYLYLHLAAGFIKEEIQGKITWEDFAIMNGAGDVNFYNLSDLDWYIGTDNNIEKIRMLRNRSVELVSLNTHVRGQLESVARVVDDRNLVAVIGDLVLQGDYREAYVKSSELEVALDRATLNETKFFIVKENIDTLGKLKLRQRHDLEDLTPPYSDLFFWTSPNLSIVEVLFWAFFGVITNLLVNSAEYLRKRNFNPNERWVAYTKLVYGPILATVMVLAIMFGWLDIGPYKARVWTLPLIGFVFGYASRRTADLFGKVQERIMGAAEKSIEEGPEKIMQERKETLALLQEAAAPKSISELKRMAKEFARQQVAVEAGIQGAKK